MALADYIQYTESLNPTARWTLQDQLGATTVADYTGNGSVGTPTGVTFGTTGPSANTAASFSGASSIAVPLNNDTAFSPPLTVLAWVNTSSSVVHQEIYKVPSTGSTLFLSVAPTTGLLTLLTLETGVNLLSAAQASFEETTAGYKNAHLTLTSDSTYALDGSDSLKMVTTTTGTDVYACTPNTPLTSMIPVVAGESYVGMFSLIDGGTYHEPWGCRIYWYGSANNQVGISAGTPIQSVGSNWQTYISGPFVAPAGAVAAMVMAITLTSNNVGEPYWMDCAGLFPADTLGYMLQVLSDQPSAYWPLTDAAGSATVKNVVGSGDGAITGGVTLGQPGFVSSDPSQTSALFDSTSGYVKTTYQNTPTSVTIEVVSDAIGTNQAAAGTSMVCLGNEGLTGYWIYMRGSSIGFEVGVGGVRYSITAVIPNDGLRHVYAFTYDGTTAKIYVDGVLKTSGGIAGPVGASTTPLVIGTGLTTGSYFFNGKLGHVAVYSSVLSAARLLAHAQALSNTSGQILNKWSAGGNTPAPVSSSVAVNDGNWHMVGVTLDASGNINFYVDGQPEGTSAGFNQWPLSSALNAYSLQVLSDNPIDYWPATDSVGVATAKNLITSGVPLNTKATWTVMGRPGVLPSDPVQTSVTTNYFTGDASALQAPTFDPTPLENAFTLEWVTDSISPAQEGNIYAIQPFSIGGAVGSTTNFAAVYLFGGYNNSTSKGLFGLYGSPGNVWTNLTELVNLVYPGVHHIAITYNGSTGTSTIYVDGVVKITGVKTGALPVTVKNLQAGLFPGQRGGHFAVYSSALSAARITAHAQAFSTIQKTPSIGNNFVGSISDVVLFNSVLTPSQIAEAYSLMLFQGTGVPSPYRAPGVLYRDIRYSYRGTTTPDLGVDLSVQDYIRMEVVNQYSEHVAWLNASALQSVNWTLNDSGDATVDLTNLDPGARNLLVFGGGELRITFTNATDYFTGEPVTWQGIPMRLQRQPGQSTLNLEGLFSYFKFRLIEYGSLMYTSVDQFDIAWGLMETYQQYMNYDRNIHASYQPSGVIRSRYYARDQHQKIYDLVQAFRSDNLQNGFDFLIDAKADGSRLWTPGYPHLGRLFPGFIEWGRDIVDYNLQDDGTQMATKVYSDGGGTGGVQLEQSYENVTASQEYGTLVSVFNDSSEEDLSWLQQVAQHQVSMRDIPIPNYQITCAYDDSNPLLGRVRPGDTVWTRIDDGMTQINQTFRVQSIGWQIDPGPSILIQYYQPNLQGYVDPLAEEASLEI